MTRFKELFSIHPLFTRLSGQIIWLLFEEREAEPEDIDAFLVLYDHLKIRTAEFMLKLMADAQSDSPGYMRITSGPGPGGWIERPPDSPNLAPLWNAPPCPYCQNLNNKLISTTDPDLLRFIPPFSLGCRAKAELVPNQKLESITTPNLINTAKDAPPAELHCQNAWIFQTPWSKIP